MIDQNNFAPSVPDTGSISIQLASPETIRSWSFGEVTKPETINYRTFKPERDGLFCEKIFGPVKNWECSCGKYKRIRYNGVVCEHCGVQVTHSRVRRERMGHIELAVPVVHIWFFKSLPSIIGQMLKLSVANLEHVIYYESYLVLDEGDSSFKRHQIITEDEYREEEDAGHHFDAKMGAPAIKQALAEIDLENDTDALIETIKTETSAQRKIDDLKRLRIMQSFRKSSNRPEWMVLDVLPVIPPDLRPLVPLDGGRFATSDLNDLYRRVINRNNRLKKLIDIKAPEVILRNEKRMLQESVDTLFDNGRRTVSVKGDGKRQLKSLSELLKGKNGRFRQNLLGKRVDYSGRSVIVVGPELKIYQCGLPKPMALELYKPFIIQKLEERGLANTVKTAKKFVEKERAEVWDILEEIINDHPVLLNRAPTLHRLGIQAFYPKLIEGKAIRLHPLVCTGFNADFDGDQMAVHLPLSFEAQLEARILMLSAFNLLHPASGQPITVPSQDMVLGNYYLTKPLGPEPKDVKELQKLRAFGCAAEVEEAVFAKALNIHDWIRYQIHYQTYDAATDSFVPQKQLIVTTGGRVLFNHIVPVEFSGCRFRGKVIEPINRDMGVNIVNGFVNTTMGKKAIQRLIDVVYRNTMNNRTVVFLDDLKDQGYDWATRSGTSVSIGDMLIPEEKKEILEKAQETVDSLQEKYEDGVITDNERYNQVIDTWSHASTDVSAIQYEKLAKDRNGFNPVFMMADSGARGSKEQIRQLSGMRGLMQKPQKKVTNQGTIETPIKSNFKEGMSVLEYFISSHGARKGMADTALKTADAGYLTRRLVDVSQDLVVTEEDCGTSKGIVVEQIMDGDEVKTPISERIIGRVPVKDVVDPSPDSDEILARAGEIITEQMAKKIESVGIDSLEVRSVLTCGSHRGVCAKCYGRNLATGRAVQIGESVGIMAAQSIGEPGTQLTLRTFHIGGAAGGASKIGEQRAKLDGIVTIPAEVKTVEHDVTDEDGRELKETIVVSRNAWCKVKYDSQEEPVEYAIRYGAVLHVKNGQHVKGYERKSGKVTRKGDLLYSWDPHFTPTIVETDGKLEYIDIVAGHTLNVEKDESTGVSTYRLLSTKSKLEVRLDGYKDRKRALNSEKKKVDAEYKDAKKNGDESSLETAANKRKNIEDQISKNDVSIADTEEKIEKEAQDRERNIQKRITEIESSKGFAESIELKKFVEGLSRLMKQIQPSVIVGNRIYSLPYGSVLQVGNLDVKVNAKTGVLTTKADVKKGDTLAKTESHAVTAHDITGGLPRVAELFEARMPKDPAVLCAQDGKIHIGDTERGKQKIIVSSAEEQVVMCDAHSEVRVEAGQWLKKGECLGAVFCTKDGKVSAVDSEDGRLEVVVVSNGAENAYGCDRSSIKVGKNLKQGDEIGLCDPVPCDCMVKSVDKQKVTVVMTGEYTIPHGKHLIVREGDLVKAGDKLCDGSVDPHDILRIKGEDAVRDYLVQEIQAVYKLQGVMLNDKHIECIVRQMLRKVRIKDPGDTNFLENEDVSRLRLRTENERMEAEGKEPATYTPLLLGITRASLGTDSFFAAASFQETTKVLTQVAVEGKTDVLEGLKENVIVGRLIPAGTGATAFANLRVCDEEAMVETMQRREELEAERREREALEAEAESGLDEDFGFDSQTAALAEEDMAADAAENADEIEGASEDAATDDPPAKTEGDAEE